MSTTNKNQLSQKEACQIFAKSWNNLDPDILINYLAEDIRYESQTVISALNGIEDVTEYLEKKMSVVKEANDNQVFAQLAKTQPYSMYPNSPQQCVVLSQGNRDNLLLTVFLKTSHNKITDIDLCIIPPPDTTKLSGEFPK